MHLLVDTTLGVFLEYLWLMALIKLFVRVTGDEKTYRFGDYSDDEGNIDQVVYLKQLALWLFSVVGMKILMVGILFEFRDMFLLIARVFLVLVSWSAKLKIDFV